MSSSTAPDLVRLRELSPADAGDLRALLDATPVENLYLRARLETDGVGTGGPEHGRFLGARLGDRLAAAAFVGKGRNLVLAWNPDDAPAERRRAITALARGLGDERWGGESAWSILIGPPEAARTFLAARGPGATACSVDRDQVVHSLRAGDIPADLEPLPVQPLAEEHLPEALDLTLALLRDDFGRDPACYDHALLFEGLRRRAAAGAVYGHLEGGRLVFLTSLSARASCGAQVGGTVVREDLRGRRLARRCLADLCARLLTDAPLVTLHVDAENMAARAAYEAVGFRPAGLLRLCLKGA